MPLHDPGSASLPASHGAIQLGRSLALPESLKARKHAQQREATKEKLEQDFGGLVVRQ
jgi:hypothetical protein